MITPRSVKAYGKNRLPPFPFEITNCDLKDWNLSVVS
jgi:hypothetical protein